MDQRSWQWLWAVCAAVGSILVFVVAVNRNIVLAVVFGALTLGALLFVMLGFQKYVKEHGETAESAAESVGNRLQRLRLDLLRGRRAHRRNNRPPLARCDRPEYRVPSGYQLVRLLRARPVLNATSADHEGKPEDERGPLSPAVETALDADRPLLQAQPVDNLEQHRKLTT